MNEDTIICDHCNNYKVSMDGCTEKCDAVYDFSAIAFRREKIYIAERLNGNKKACKYFKRIRVTSIRY